MAAAKEIVEPGYLQQGMMRAIQNILENCQETSRRTVLCVYIARELSMEMGKRGKIKNCVYKVL
jgi:hypothetical protein